MNSNNKHISFNNVDKSFSNKKVLNKLSFALKENDFTALIGNNGCGKTTSINIFCNLLAYNKGDVLVLGNKVTPNYVTYKHKLGIVLSTPYFIEEFTPIEYLTFVGRFQKIDREEILNRINDLFYLFELEEQKYKPIKNLSSGIQMKVSLAAALIHNPPILILDEPFINLDINTTNTILNILKGFKGKKTIFITSHNLDLVADLCDMFLIMEKGKITNEFEKSNFNSTEELKNKMKEVLIEENKLTDLSWLK